MISWDTKKVTLDDKCQLTSILYIRLMDLEHSSFISSNISSSSASDNNEIPSESNWTMRMKK